MKPWKQYEETARLVLERVKDHFGLSNVEGPQRIPGKDTDWEVEAKGVDKDSEGVIIIECRLTKRRQTQEEAGALAFRITNTGAEGAILVTHAPLQKGAAAIAAGNKIRHVMLDRNSTPGDFALRFLNHLFLGVTGIVEVNSFGSLAVQRGCQKCGAAFPALDQGKLCPSCTDI